MDLTPSRKGAKNREVTAAPCFLTRSQTLALVCYDSIDVSKSDRQTEGQLSERPLAELIREIIDADLSGAIRLSNGLAKVVVYFEKGVLLFASSNLRAHRLREVLKRNQIAERQIAEFPSMMSDEEVGAALVRQAAITPAVLQEMRLAQVTDVLRVALLWTDGQWSYDRRVRVEGDLRVSIDIGRLLLECARHLPLTFIRSRLDVGAAKYSVVKVDDISLSSTETLTLARISESGQEVSFADLATKGLREQDALRSTYALSVAGVVFVADHKSILSDGPKSRPVIEPVKKAAPPVGPAAPEADASALFTRLYSAKTHYEVLDVSSGADLAEIKKAYHDFARRFHPDRFHQSDLRAKVESAFARIARAYETLNDEKRRRDYDQSLVAKRAAKPASSQAKPATPTETKPKPAGTGRAEDSFQRGTEAMQRNKHDEAIRCFGEAAMLAPNVARYRAYYGSALMRDANSRRTAETELLAALKLEPNNAAFRVMLAELYQQIGLRKRAEHEATRALSADPTNTAARSLLANLTNK